MRDNSMDRYDDLQVALNVARDNLKSLNEKIGRDQFRDTRKRPHWDRDNANGQHKSFDDAEKRTGHRNDQFNHPAGGGGKRSRQNVFSRLEPRSHGNRSAVGEPKDTPKPRLSSRVTKEVPRREDVVAAQSDAQSRARNKRMFGSLLGTLNKFCQDESRLRGRVEKKAIIEKKVEEQELRERETSKLERRNLFVDRKKKLMEVRLLEIKMERMQDLSAWEENQKKTREFIRTTAGPRIYFLPKAMNEKTTTLLQESQRQYDEELAKKREDIQKELVEVEERLQRELEKALEEKPTRGTSEREEGMQLQGDGDRHNLSVEDEGQLRPGRGKLNEEEMDEEDGELDSDEEEHREEVHRPRLVSQVVIKSSQVAMSVKNSDQAEQRRRHVLQSAVNKKMIISVVNNTYEGGGGRRF